MEVFGSEPCSRQFLLSSFRFSREHFPMLHQNSLPFYHQIETNFDHDESSSERSSLSPTLPFPEPIRSNQNCSTTKQTSENLSKMPIPGFNPERTRRSAPPTLATGRRSKFIQLEGEAAVKRDQRRRRNREAARKLKEKRTLIEQQLEKAIQDLEDEEKELRTEVKNLQKYKILLQQRFQQTNESISSRMFNVVQHVDESQMNEQFLTSHRIDREKNFKIRPKSPQWQILFGI